MKKTIFIISAIFIFLTFASKTAFSQALLEEFSKRNGELQNLTVEISLGNANFGELFSYFKSLFLKEFFEMKTTFVAIGVMIIVSSLVGCISCDKILSKTLNLTMNSFMVLSFSELTLSLFSSASDAVTQINDFLLFSVPYYCSFLCAVAKPVSAAKGSLISLGCGSILSQLITNVFFPLTHIFYVICISSSLMENDIFRALKKLLKSSLKVVLPVFVGLYTTVLTLFLKTSSNSDDLTFKTAKTAIGGAVPFLGNVLNQSADAVLSSVEILRSQIGIAGVVCLFYLMSKPLFKLLIGILMFRLFASLSCFFGNEKQSELFSDMAEVTEIYASVTGTVGIIAIITVMLLIG